MHNGNQIDAHASQIMDAMMEKKIPPDAITGIAMLVIVALLAERETKDDAKQPMPKMVEC